jgi:hypothetical protein
MDSETVAYDEEHLKIITCLLKLEAELNATPKHGGLEFGRRKFKAVDGRAIACTLSILPRSWRLLQRILGGTLG